VNSNINELVDKNAALEKKLLDELDTQQEKFQYHLEGTRVKFEQKILEAHRKLKMRFCPGYFLPKYAALFRRLSFMP